MRFLYQACLFVVTFVLLYHGLYAQNIVVKNLPTQRFLPSANLHHIVKDEEGYMWYATEGGLCRDNGYQIDVFVDLAVGKGHRIWVATEAGLY